jgi:hypothetical protein
MDVVVGCMFDVHIKSVCSLFVGRQCLESET